MTGMETALMTWSIMSGSLIRATPPWARMSAGTRSSAITATAPASSAIFAWSGVTTSMITPPLSISAMPRLTRVVPVTRSSLRSSGCCSAMLPMLVLGRRRGRFGGSGGQRLPADEQDPLDDGDRAQRRDQPDGDLVEPRDPEHVTEEGGHQQPDET